MAKQLTQQQREVLEGMFQILKESREAFRREVGRQEESIAHTLDKMAKVQIRMDALAVALGLPDGASRE